MPIENIPAGLRGAKRWIPCDRNKKPIDSYATEADRARTLRTLDDWAASDKKHGTQRAGYQYWIDRTCGYIFVDVDGCLDDAGKAKPEAEKILKGFQRTYYEKSIGGRGLHFVFSGGPLAEDFKKTPGCPVEIYSGNISNKLFLLTGDTFDQPTIPITEGKAFCEALLAKCKAGFEPPKFPGYDIAAPILRDADQTCDDETAPYLVVDAKGNLDILDVASPQMEVYDMPADVLSGRLREIYEQYLSSFPRAYGYLALLACAAVKVPRASFRTNLFGCPVGPIHSGKSQSFEQAAQLLGLEKPILTRVKAGSMEGLISRLTDAQGADRLIFVNELGHLLAKANIEHASYSYILNDAFYDDDVDLVVAGRKEVRAKVRLSIFGGVVEEQFGDHFRESSLGGLYDRFVFSVCPKPFTYLYRPMEAATLDSEPVPVRVSPEVYDARDEWIKRNIIENPRVAEIAIRTAVICASMDGRETLDGKNLTAALEWARYQQAVRETLLPNVGRNQNAEAEERIRNVIRKRAKPGEWLEARQIEQYGHIKRDFGTMVLESVLAAMRRAGEIDYMDVTSARNGKVKKLVKLAADEVVAK